VAGADRAATMDRKTLKQAIGKILEAHGFRRKGQSWYLQHPDVVGVIELQKSDLSECYYMNIGFLVRSLDPSHEYPPERLCHWRYRVEAIFPEMHIPVRRDLLSLGEEADDAERIEELQKFLTERVAPFVASIRTVDDIRKQRSSEWFSHGFLHVELRKLLDRENGRGLPRT
jgi:hypothetical protein